MMLGISWCLHKSAWPFLAILIIDWCFFSLFFLRVSVWQEAFSQWNSVRALVIHGQKISSIDSRSPKIWEAAFSSFLPGESKSSGMVRAKCVVIASISDLFRSKEPQTTQYGTETQFVSWSSGDCKKPNVFCLLSTWWNVVVTLILLHFKMKGKSSNLTWLNPRPSDGVLSSRPDDRTQFFETKLQCFTDRPTVLRMKYSYSLHLSRVDFGPAKKLDFCYPKLAEAKGVHHFICGGVFQTSWPSFWPLLCCSWCRLDRWALAFVFDPSLCQPIPDSKIIPDYIKMHQFLVGSNALRQMIVLPWCWSRLEWKVTSGMLPHGKFKPVQGRQCDSRCSLYIFCDILLCMLLWVIVEVLVFQFQKCKLKLIPELKITPCCAKCPLSNCWKVRMRFLVP